MHCYKNKSANRNKAMYSKNDWRNYSNELYHYQRLGAKWGVRNGPPYPLSVDKLTDNIYSNASRHVNEIESDIRKCIKGTSSKLYGLEHKLKTKESIKRKIEKEAAEENITPNKAAAKIKDAVRFTTISDNKDYVSNYLQFKQSMEHLGYSETKCKNYFDMYSKGLVKHKSVQSTFQTKDGYEFEIQFHTPGTQDAKNKKLPLYEERRQVGIDPERAAYLESKMVELAENVVDPPNIELIKTHK